MIITYYGHSCFSVEIGGKQLLFDPFIRPNQLAAHINVDVLNPDYILISHGHWDHLSDALEIANNSGAQLISNFEICDWFGAQGLTKLNHMNAGGKKKFDWGTVQLTSSLHSSGLPDKSYGGLAAGFIIDSEEGKFYYAGDTALSMEMELIGRFHKIDFAFLPIGGNFTMDADDAVLCADMIKCNHIIGMHYDSFPPIAIDKAVAGATFKNVGKDLSLINIGESLTINARA